MHDCLIIGGGIAGLMAGHRLKNSGKSVLILDKGKGLGGRLATRRVTFGEGTTYRFDYGAQYFTVREKYFQLYVDRWLQEDIIKLWAEAFSKMDGGKSSHKSVYIGKNGIREITKDLASGLNTRSNTLVTAIDYNENTWIIQTESGDSYSGGSLIMTPPVPQILDLLQTFEYSFPEEEIHLLKNLSYNPCFALLVLLGDSSSVPQPGGILGDENPIRWMADNKKKGISPEGTAITIHASADFTKLHFNAPPDDIADKLLSAARPWMKSEDVLSWQLHRWRYSQPINPMRSSFYQLSAPGPLLLAGDFFTAGRVESAALSGYQAANQLFQMM